MAFMGLNLGGGMALTGGISAGVLVGHVVADISKWTSGLAKATIHLKKFAAKMDQFLQKNAAAMSMLGRRAAVVGAAVTAGIGVMVKSYGNFERRMRRAAAVSDYTENQFIEMSKMAEKASIDLNISATQTADAFYYLGSAGLSVQEQMAAFPDVLNFAKAGVMDVGDAAENLVDVMKGAHVSFDETTRVTDILTAAFTSSNTTLAQLGEAMSLVTSIARDSHTPINQVAAAFGLMANAGIKGSRAGTALRRAFVNLMDPSSEMREVLNELNISVYDNEGRMKELADIMVETMEAIENVTESQRKHAIATVFGVRAITGIQAILSIGAEKYREYNRAMKESAGATQDVVNKQMKAFLEQVGTLNQEIARLARHLGKTLAPAVRNITDLLKPMVEGFTKWVDAHKELTTALIATAGAMGIATFGLGLLLMNLGSAALISTTLGTSFWALVGATSGVVLGIGAIVAAGVYLIARTGEIDKGTRDLKETFEGMDKQLKKSGEEWKKFMEIIGETKMGKSLDIRRKIIEDEIKIERDALEKYVKYVEGLSWYEKLLIADRLKNIKKFHETKLKLLEKMLLTVDKAGKKEVEKVKDTEKAKTQAALIEEERRMTIFELAWKHRQKLYEAETKELENLYGVVTDKWSDLDLRMAESMEKAMEDMEESMTTFFENTAMDANNWRDHLVSLLEDIRRAIARAFAERLVTQMMAAPFMKTLLGNVLGPAIGAGLGGAGAGAGAGAGTSIPSGLPEAAAAWTPPAGFQKGGIVNSPTLALLGEKGREAVIPLEGGRSVPVEFEGGQIQREPQSHVTFNMTVQAIDSMDTYRFLSRNRRRIASMIQQARIENHPLRRGM